MFLCRSLKSLLGNALFSQLSLRRLRCPNASIHLPSPPPRIHPDHKFRICPRHDLYVFLNQKGIIELARRFRLSMLNITDPRVDANLDPCDFPISNAADLLITDWARLIGICYCCREVQDRSHGNGVLEGARI